MLRTTAVLMVLYRPRSFVSGRERGSDAIIAAIGDGRIDSSSRLLASLFWHNLNLRLRDRRPGLLGQRRADDERHGERPQRVAVPLDWSQLPQGGLVDHHRR